MARWQTGRMSTCQSAAETGKSEVLGRLDEVCPVSGHPSMITVYFDLKSKYCDLIVQGVGAQARKVEVLIGAI